jgi:hypothetical protein
MALDIARLERAISRMALAISEFPLRPRRAIILRHPKVRQSTIVKSQTKIALSQNSSNPKDYKTTK